MKDSFNIINKEGKLIKYDILFSFKNESNNKDYIVYTDYSKDINNNINIYTARYCLKNSKIKLETIEKEEELKYVETILNSIREELKN